jgi:alpha-glucosidase
MEWNAEAHGGFTTGEPWLPVGNDYVHENVTNLFTEIRKFI